MERAVAVLVLAYEVAVGLRGVGVLGLDGAQVVGFAEDVIVVPQIPADVDAVVALDQAFLVGLVDRSPGVGHDLVGRQFHPHEVVLRIPRRGGDVARGFFDRPAVSRRIARVGRM